MPKLTKKVAKDVEATELREGGDFSEPLPGGTYTAKLEEVTVEESKAGSEYWKWTFRLTDPRADGRFAWVNTSLDDKAKWKLKEVFHAFGYSADSDTDEMIGEEVSLRLKVATIQAGARVGEKTNEVTKVLPLDDEARDARGDDSDETEPDSKGF